MTRKKRRSAMILGGLAIIGLAVGLALYGLGDAVTFFYSPSDLATKKVLPGQRFRLGGLVEKGSLKRGEGVKISFKVTDNARSVPVVYEGILPDLFNEGQGVVTEGVLDASGTFVADSVLAKHDENYMPPEVADSLKKSGKWTEKDTKAVKGGGS